MATWVTHLIIADRILERYPQLDRRGFCVGNIAPDCNVENEDWSGFTPPREVTHWMRGSRKALSDCDAFCKAFILRPGEKQPEEYAFLLGYYSHLLTDAAFQTMIRDPERVRAVWRRIRADSALSRKAAGMEESWDSVKQLYPKKAWTQGIRNMEAEYLQCHPDCGYLTQILPLEAFPDYIDYLPKGCIVRKIRVMGNTPVPSPDADFIPLSRQEYAAFLERSERLIVERFCHFHLL